MRTRPFVHGVWLLGLLNLCACGGGHSEGGGSVSPPMASQCAPAPTSFTVVDVKAPPYSARGDGLADDTAAIQRAVDAVGGTGGTVYVSDGTYLINAVANPSGGKHGLALKSNMTLQLASGAVLKAMPNDSGAYMILMVGSVHQVNIVGGTVEGERGSHAGITGESGMGISILSSSHVVVEGVMARECWGDGFYVGGSTTCQDVTFCHVTSDHNRRQGMSITNANGLVVRDSTFKNTTGTLPEAGIDIEPNAGEIVSHVQILDCVFTDNAGDGIACGVPIAETGQATVDNVVIDGNTIFGNGVHPADASSRDGIEVSNCSGTSVTHNACTNNAGRGILFRDNANHSACTGNTVTGTLGNPGDGIEEVACSGNAITGNTSSGNAGHGIYSVNCTGSTISGNTVTGNGKTP